jgi:hypothetical protein
MTTCTDIDVRPYHGCVRVAYETWAAGRLMGRHATHADAQAQHDAILARDAHTSVWIVCVYA